MNRYHLAPILLLVALLLMPAAPLSGQTRGAGAAGSLDVAAEAELGEGFLDRSWGVQPEGVPGARPVAGLGGSLAVYTADLDLLPILGTVAACSNPRLVFSEQDGLVQVYTGFDARGYGQVRRHLTGLLGEPASDPVVYELMVAGNGFEERSEWLIGRNTRLTLVSGLEGAFVELGRRDSSFHRPRNFEEMLAAALLKQATEYERRKLITEASSVYQELLTGDGSWRSFTSAAQERLADYSRHKDGVDYLGQDGGVAFSLLKSIFSGQRGQQWIKLDLGFTAREELKRQRPAGIKPQDGLAGLSAVLCRVRPDAVRGKYSVVEQIWLDGSGRIIGGRPAWAPQDAGWPAPFIRQACEEFLEAWFSPGLQTNARRGE